MRNATSHRLARVSIPALVVVLAVTGCTQQPSAPAARESAEQPASQPSAWKLVDGSPQVALPAEEQDSALARASAQARETAAAAALRWRNAPTADRPNWAVKWAAPTMSGGVEYIWVEPLTWTEFRIEGRLASPPQHALSCGKRLDEIVGFPIEELADWVHFIPAVDSSAPGNSIPAMREGGFTMKLLEERYGSVPATSTGE